MAATAADKNAHLAGAIGGMAIAKYTHNKQGAVTRILLALDRISNRRRERMDDAESGARNSLPFYQPTRLNK